MMWDSFQEETGTTQSHWQPVIEDDTCKHLANNRN